MERTVPSTASEEIELYLRTVYSLLRSTTEVQIRTLEEVHAGMNSLLHQDARESSPDMSAFIYSILRLPPVIDQVRSVVLGQSQESFYKGGYDNVERWEQVSAAARRRRCFYNGQDTLVCYIASRTDIEDLIPTLTAYQIEWNKIHFLLENAPNDFDLRAAGISEGAFQHLAEILEISPEDLERLRIIWGPTFIAHLEEMRARKVSFRVRLLGGSLVDYWRATRTWWETIARACTDVLTHPIYFVSSNTHSIANLLSGFALTQRRLLEAYVQNGGSPYFLETWQAIRSEKTPASIENFLYFISREYQRTPEGRPTIEQQFRHEEETGIIRVRSEHVFDVDAQIIDMGMLKPEYMDPRLLRDPNTGKEEDYSFLKDSNAIILNIDYPLGLAAYNILSTIAGNVNAIQGVYVLGKAATLNGVLGDVMIPNVIQDEHSRNTYLFQNCITAADVSPYLTFGTVLDNQKAVSVFGTFLQNARIMDVFYREGYTDIEQEGGPYLSAVYEMYRPQRHPINEIVNLYPVPFDVGIVHYASDKPLSKGKNLGAGSLSYFGMDATYASSIAILRRIFQNEKKRRLQG